MGTTDIDVDRISTSRAMICPFVFVCVKGDFMCIYVNSNDSHYNTLMGFDLHRNDDQPKFKYEI